MLSQRISVESQNWLLRGPPYADKSVHHRVPCSVCIEFLSGVHSGPVSASLVKCEDSCHVLDVRRAAVQVYCRENHDTQMAKISKPPTPAK